MALKKEDRLFGYSEKIGVNRGGGFQFASQVAKSQANDIDNLVGRFADAGLKDLQAFGETEAKKAKDLGFSGKGSIHPKQIPIINKVFTPSESEIIKAKKIIAAFEKANTGLLVIDGKLIEKPVLREMYRLISLSKKQ